MLSKMSIHILRKDTEVFLIGHYSPQIIGTKLPSIGQVLKVLFFNTREVKLSLRESATLVIEETIIFWNKARIPTRDKQHCIKQLVALHIEWAKLHKSINKPHVLCREKERNFVDKLDDLFDIAHANALNMIKITEDKEFLLKQRMKGRPGYMLGIDCQLTEKEEKVTERDIRETERYQKSQQEIAELCK